MAGLVHVVRVYMYAFLAYMYHSSVKKRRQPLSPIGQYYLGIEVDSAVSYPRRLVEPTPGTSYSLAFQQSLRRFDGNLRVSSSIERKVIKNYLFGPLMQSKHSSALASNNTDRRIWSFDQYACI